VLEGALFVDGNFRYVSKEEAETFDNTVFVVKEGMSNLANSVASCGQYLLCWPIRWSADCFPNEDLLAGRDHVANSRYVVEHSPYVFVLYPFLTYSPSSLKLAGYVKCFDVKKLQVC
jgi:hypothetical protein